MTEIKHNLGSSRKQRIGAGGQPLVRNLWSFSASISMYWSEVRCLLNNAFKIRFLRDLYLFTAKLEWRSRTQANKFFRFCDFGWKYELRIKRKPSAFDCQRHMACACDKTSIRENREEKRRFKFSGLACFPTEKRTIQSFCERRMGLEGMSGLCLILDNLLFVQKPRVFWKPD